MKIKLASIALIISFIGCNHMKDNNNELNCISFKISKESMIDSLKTATTLLDKMDYGNGATCFIVNEKLHYTGKEKGFTIIDIKNTPSPDIEPLSQVDSKRLVKLILFLNKNDIHSIVKRYDKLYFFPFKQRVLNPNNDFKQSRVIVYLKEAHDSGSKFFNNMVVLDRYKNLQLLAPNTYNEPKLPMDKKSIIKRSEESMKKQ